MEYLKEPYQANSTEWNKSCVSSFFTAFQQALKSLFIGKSYSLMQKTDKICKLYFAFLKNLAFFREKICTFQKIVVILQRQKKY